MSAPTARDATNAVVERAAGVAQVAWDDVAPADLPGHAAALVEARAMLDAALVDLTEQIEASGAATALGWASTKDLLTHLTGGRNGTGGGLVRTAEQTRDLPEVRQALRTGAISLAQARVIAGRVGTLPRSPELRTAAAEKMLAMVAAHRYDATDLDKCFAAVVAQLDPDGRLLRDDRARELHERGAHHARHLSFAPDTVGGVRIRGYASAEEAEWVKTCLMPLAAPHSTQPGACGGDPGPIGRRDQHGRRTGASCPDPTCAHDGKDPRDHGTRMWDALVEACDRLAATDSLPRDHAVRARVVVTVDYDDLRAQVGQAQADPASVGQPGEGRLGPGTPLSAATVRRMACDAEIIPAVLGSESQVLDLGRSRRLVTPALFHALVLRDRHCAFPGCDRLPLACDAHHVTHWADGGRTSLDNLVLLCRRHHTLVHHSPWTITIDPRTRRPSWRPPPSDDRGRFTYRPPTTPPAQPPRHPLVA